MEVTNYLSRLTAKLVDEVDLQKHGLYTFINPYSYLQLRQQPQLLLEIDAILVDGAWLCHFLGWFGVKQLKRMSFDMTSLAPRVFEHAQKQQLSVAVIGARQNEIEKTKTNLIQQWPQLNITLAHNGYFDAHQREQLIDKIVRENTALVVVGMGSVLQEQFLLELKQAGWQGLGFSCGGFLHQSSKRLNYYPCWIDRYNLRWVYRITQEPRLFIRYFFWYPVFVCYFLKDFLTMQRPENSKHTEND